MTDYENQITPGSQNDFMKSTYQEFDVIYKDPKANMYDDEPGEQDAKSRFASRVVWTLLCTALGYTGLLAAACMNKSAEKALSGTTALVTGLVLLIFLGWLLLTNKDVRSNTSLSVWLIGFWCASVAILGTYLTLYMGASRTIVTLELSKVVAVIAVYLGTTRTKKIENLKKNMVVAFIMTELLVILGVVFFEVTSKGEGYLGGATLLSLAMLVGAIEIFYLTFALLVIQIPEAEQDLEDVWYYAVRIYIDVIYAVFLVLAMAWDKVWK